MGNLIRWSADHLKYVACRERCLREAPDLPRARASGPRIPGPREDSQALLFEFTYTNPLIFDIAPSLMVGVDDSGNKIGVVGYSLKEFVSGEVNFTVTLMDDGA